MNIKTFNITEHIDWLWGKAKQYPFVYFEKIDDVLVAATIVGIKSHDDKKYQRLCAESIMPNKTVGANGLYEKLIKNAQENIEYGIPCEIDKLIP